jgi:hypothetical protein
MIYQSWWEDFVNEREEKLVTLKKQGEGRLQLSDVRTERHFRMHG